MTAHKSKLKSEKGSALLITLIMALLIGIIIATILPMVITEYKMTFRQSMINAAFGLAEAGAEEALWALNECSDEEDYLLLGWKPDDSGNYLTRELTTEDFPWGLEDGFEGRIRIVMESPNGVDSVNIWIEGKVSGSAGIYGEPIYRVIEIQAGTSSSNSRAHLGLIAREGLNFNGQPTFDSYNSDVFPYFYVAGVNSGQNVTVGSPADWNNSINLGNAKVYGDVVSGNSEPWESGAVKGNHPVITGSIIGDFEYDFSPVEIPDTQGWTTNPSF